MEIDWGVPTRLQGSSTKEMKQMGHHLHTQVLHAQYVYPDLRISLRCPSWSTLSHHIGLQTIARLLKGDTPLHQLHKSLECHRLVIPHRVE